MRCSFGKITRGVQGRGVSDFYYSNTAKRQNERQGVNYNVHVVVLPNVVEADESGEIAYGFWARS